MSFKVRNSIVLAAVFLVITGGGLFYYLYLQPRQLETSKKDIARMERELQEMPSLINIVAQLDQSYVDIKRRYDSRSKEIPTSDVSSQTYAYMSRGIDESGSITFNMRYGGEEKVGEYGYNSYDLYEGKATFEELYKFIYYLENGRRLYKIASINIDQREGIDDETKETKSWVLFAMELRAYFSTLDVLSTSLAATSLPIQRPSSNPFNPIILQALSAEAPLGQIDVNTIDVKAVLPGKVFVLHGSELLVLHVGDKVWRGSVTRISPAESLVEFTLDEGGVMRKVQKKIIFEVKKR
jgi:hypothetical protein